MSLGDFAGGLAEGAQDGVKLAKGIADAKRQKRKDEGSIRSKAILDAATSDADVASDYTVDKGAAAAIAGIKPEISPAERLRQAIARRMRPQEAAASAGIQTQPIVLPPVEGAAPGATPPAGGIPAPEGEAAPVEVTAPPATRKMTDTERTRLMIRAAVEREDPEQAQALMKDLTIMQQRDLKYDLVKAKGRGMSGMANFYEKQTGSVVDYTPVEGGKFKVTVDGEDFGTKTADEFGDRMLELVEKDPTLGLEASLKRGEADRVERDITLREDVAKATKEIARMRAESDGRVNSANIDRTRVLTDQDREELEAARATNAVTNRFQSLLTGGEEVGDAMVNADELARHAAAMVAQGKGSYSKVVNDPGSEGGQRVETGNYFDDAAKAVIAGATARLQHSPFGPQSKTPMISVAKTPGGNFYTVTGLPGGGFKTLDAAERAARRLPPVQAAPKK